MPDLDQLRQPDNLRRAWRWLRSNPDAAYKSYFRSLYQRFAIAEDALLDDLVDRLRRCIYEPEPSTKLFHPKASGLLRPDSLLSVEDQIVYQNRRDPSARSIPNCHGTTGSLGKGNERRTRSGTNE